MLERWRTRLRANGLLRFKLMVGAALFVLAIGNAVALEGQRAANHRDCVERQERAQATAPALAKLVAAHSKDHDVYAERVWRQYLDAARRNPLPKC